MNLFKRIAASTVFAGALLVGLSANVSASELEPVTFDSDNAFLDPTTGEYIQPFRILEDGSVEFISESEYLGTLPETDNTVDIPRNPIGNKFEDVNPAYTETWTFKRSGSRTQVQKARIKASPSINCTTPSCSASISVGASTSNGFSVSATAEKNAIKAGAGYTWTTTSSSSSKFSYKLKKGDQGYVGFNPYHWKVNGTLTLRGSQGVGVIKTKAAWGTYPKKLSNGQADGVYSFVYTKRG